MPIGSRCITGIPHSVGCQATNINVIVFVFKLSFPYFEHNFIPIHCYSEESKCTSTIIMYIHKSKQVYHSSITIVKIMMTLNIC